jgi:hypothetical protein
MTNSNDPREYKKFVFVASYWPSNTVYDRINQDEINSKILRDDCKFISFSKLYNDYFGFEYSNMWAHYGERHKGICLKIHKEKFERENETIIKRGSINSVTYYELDLSKQFYHPEVQYPQNQSQDAFKSYLRNEFRHENMEFLYFLKREEWFTEHEVRLVIFSDSKEKEYCSIRDSLAGIILGLDYNSKNDHRIYSFSQDIPFSKMDYTGDRIVEKAYNPSSKSPLFRLFQHFF